MPTTILYMRKSFVLLLVLTTFLSSCSGDDVRDTNQLSGIYTEITPIEGRTQLAFIGGNKVIKVSEGSSHSDEFHYEIIGNKIKFTLVGVDPQSSEIYFERLDKTSFTTGNLYVSIPENPPVYIRFRKMSLMD